ncbi:hypothetical protein AOQ84DRAFT_373209, partial [Glonium stellatum]
MTQPLNVNMTFDTSLIDLSAEGALPQNTYPSTLYDSFSTTASESSDTAQPTATNPASNPPNTNHAPDETPKETQEPTRPTPTPPPKPSTPIQHLPTLATYNAWAPIYDTDGNILQAIDDLELTTLLPDFLSRITSPDPHDPATPLRILDLGCGTGRNTAKLLTHAWPPGLDVRVTGVDFSAGMLEVARRKLEPLEKASSGVEL